MNRKSTLTTYQFAEIILAYGGTRHTCLQMLDIVHAQVGSNIHMPATDIPLVMQGLFGDAGIHGTIENIGGVDEFQLPAQNVAEYIKMRLALAEHLQKAEDKIIRIKVS